MSDSYILLGPSGRDCLVCGKEKVSAWYEVSCVSHNLGTVYECKRCRATYTLADVHDDVETWRLLEAAP